MPDIVVGTPSRVLAHLEAGHLDGLRSSLELLVMDEADLIVSFGYESDVKKVLTHLPPTCQAVLTSATLNDDVAKLKGLVLHNPVTLKLEEQSALPEESQLTQYRIYVEEQVKHVSVLRQAICPKAQDIGEKCAFKITANLDEHFENILKTQGRKSQLGNGPNSTMPGIFFP